MTRNWDAKSTGQMVGRNVRQNHVGTLNLHEASCGLVLGLYFTCEFYRGMNTAPGEVI